MSNIQAISDELWNAIEGVRNKILAKDELLENTNHPQTKEPIRFDRSDLIQYHNGMIEALRIVKRRLNEDM